jgi:hypothetical protein
MILAVGIGLILPVAALAQWSSDDGPVHWTSNGAHHDDDHRWPLDARTIGNSQWPEGILTIRQAQSDWQQSAAKCFSRD